MTRAEIEALGGDVYVWAGDEDSPLLLRRRPPPGSGPWELWRTVGNGQFEQLEDPMSDQACCDGCSGTGKREDGKPCPSCKGTGRLDVGGGK
jgi:hypothetical protein